ncbi:toll-like receptor 4 [Mercenaria mercenaria]|uniref:toll-like receptor 4 n=1 Tax=Mercenaria mercenaria TaxID=6596 RepID=UPI00234F10FE|nr:toll-like receptor 4 [Mercenaria mercenaria]
MKRLGVLFLAMLGICVASSPCGPGGKCDCSNYTQTATEMRCSIQLELKTICASLANDTLHKVTRLTSSKLNDTNLTTDDLTGCESLQELCLTKNALEHIQEHALWNMSKLTHLDLSLNNLDVYRNGPRYEFWLPANLRILKLNGNIPNNIDTNLLNYPVFYPSNVLRELYLDGLPNKDFDVFRGDPNLLQGVTVSGMSGYCSLSQVTHSTFGALLNLTFLNITSCKISMFEFGAVKELKKLEVLDISYNKQLGLKALENISYGLQFTNIKSFNFSHADNKFGPARTVEKRDLCYLWNTSLQELVMEGNRIQMVESNGLILIPSSLNILRIGYNRLTIAMYIMQVGCLGKLTDLHSGFLDVSAFHEQPLEVIENISKDEEDCRGNQTSACPFMSDTYLKNISSGKQNCLFYDGSTIPLSIPKQIKNIYSPQCGFVSALISILNHASSLDLPIERLDVSGNKIYRISSINIKFEQMKHLDISDNHCRSLAPRTGLSVPNLEQLHMQKNLLGFSISEHHFTYFGNLRVLNLSDNVLQNLPEHVFFNLTKLEVLDLSYNKIQNWTADVSALKSLKHLNLSNNVIGYLPPSLTTNFEKRPDFSVDLQNNTIQCACEYKDFLFWLVRHKDNMVGYEKYIFYDVDNARELNVNQFEYKVSYLNKYCGSYTVFIVVASLFITSFLFVILGGIAYKTRWQIRYFVYITKRRYFSYKKVPNENTEEIFKYEAFISYAEDNNHFIAEELIPKLEQQGLSLCVHQRDFVPGRSVIDNIVGAIQNSRKTVVILSREFINSRWCMYEFQMARMESIYSRDEKGCLLIVMKDKIQIEEMPLEMINWIRYESYLEYTEQTEGELLFWQKLIESLKDM